MTCKERLTMHTPEGACLIINTNNETDAQQELMEKFKLACNKLAELEDKLENGTMIDLPCKIGDTVYFVLKNILEITKGKIKEIIINKYNDAIINVDFSYMCKQFDIKYVGKTVFLTKEEAEARLKELQNG